MNCPKKQEETQSVFVGSSLEDTKPFRTAKASKGEARLAKGILTLLLPALVWLSLWQIASLNVGQELLLPSPFLVAETLAELVVTVSFWESVTATLNRVFWGIFFGTVGGFLLGWVSFFLPLARNLLSPLMKTVQATPVVSFILLVLLWTKRDHVPMVVSALMVLPLIWSSTKKGLEETDPSLIVMGRAYGFSGFQRSRLIYLPSCLPYFVNGLSSGISLGWKSGVAAEVICTPPLAVGTAMSQSKMYLDTPRLLAWTAVVIVLSAGMDWVLQKATLCLSKKRLG